METSDSDCFESADEELLSEDETCVKTVSVKPKTTSENLDDFNQLSLTGLTESRKVEKENPANTNSSSSANNRKEAEPLKNSKTGTVEYRNVSSLAFNEKIGSSKNSSSSEDEKKFAKILTSDITSRQKEQDVSSQPQDSKSGDEMVQPSEQSTLNSGEENMWDDDNWDLTTDKPDNLKIISNLDKFSEKQLCLPIDSNCSNKLNKMSNKTVEVPSALPEDITDRVKKETSMWDDDENWEPVSSDSKLIGDKQDGLKKQESEQDNMWNQEEDWEPVEPVDVNRSQAESVAFNNWSSWGNWGVSSILTTASHSVTTLTNQVSQGITTVFEAGMGIPDPEELARLNKEEKEKLEKASINIKEPEPDNNNTNKGFGFGNLGNLVTGVNQITKFMESTGTKVITGGLDTLETIGKKTMEVLQEGDPGLKKKRAFLTLHQDKTNLSQVLREAKEKAEQENKIREEKHLAKNKKNYETLFDDHQGLVHLEALEMLSKQCDIKLETMQDNLVGDQLNEFQETVDQVKELCELPEDDDEEHYSYEDIKSKIKSSLDDLNVSISYDKLISTWEETESWLQNLNLQFCGANELHQQAIESMAQLTAICVEQFHKCAELLLVKEHRSTADEADSLVQLTVVLKALMLVVSERFTTKLNDLASNSGNKEEANELITNVFFEAANSSTYIQNAFQLLIPIIQVGAV